MRFREWLLKEEDLMGGPPGAGGGMPPPGGPPGAGSGMPPPGGGMPPMDGGMGGDPLGGMGGGGMGGAASGGPLTQSQFTKMKSISAWDAIAEVLSGKDGKDGNSMKKQNSNQKHLMQ